MRRNVTLRQGVATGRKPPERSAAAHGSCPALTAVSSDSWIRGAYRFDCRKRTGNQNHTNRELISRSGNDFGRNRELNDDE